MELDSQSANLSKSSAANLVESQNHQLAEARPITSDRVEGKATQAQSDRKDVSVLFSDINGYNTLTENLGGEEVNRLLSEYFELMGAAVFKYKQNLAQQIESACIGNSIVAIFGSPQPLEHHAWMAVQMASEMSHALVNFNTRRQATQQRPIRMAVGIHSDSTLGGHIGANKQMEFTAIGNGVNLGHRLEAVSKHYVCEVILSENTYRLCADHVWVRELDSIHVPGKTNPTLIYELIGLRSEPISPQKQQLIEHYAKARQHYLNRKFALAMAEFATALEVESNDKPSAIHLARCQRLLKEPPPENWDGTWSLKD